jgi:hypothetical protein
MIKPNLIEVRNNSFFACDTAKSAVVKLIPDKKERGPEPRPLLQATILFHLRGRLNKS